MPCLSFCWELVTPPCWQARSYGPGLLPSDPGAAPIWPFGSLGVPELLARPGTRHAHGLRRNTSPARRNPGRHAVRGAHLRRVVHPVGFGDDATDHRPPGPQCRRSRAQVSVHPESRGPQGTASLHEDPSAIRAHSRLDSGLVITSQGEAARSDQADNWLRAIGEALFWGSDRSDRFQTVARWRGEITPRDAPVGGSAEPLRALPGWSTWRFTGASWPGEASRVELGR